MVGKVSVKIGDKPEDIHITFDGEELKVTAINLDLHVGEPSKMKIEFLKWQEDNDCPNLAIDGILITEQEYAEYQSLLMLSRIFKSS